MAIKDRFDGWLIIDTDKLKEAIKALPPYYRKFSTIKKMLGFNPRQFTEYVEGKRYPSLQNFKKLCIYLQISADELLGLDTIPDEIDEIPPTPAPHSDPQ